MTSITVALCVCSVALPAVAQRNTIPVSSPSQHGSPVALSGTATSTDTGAGVIRYSIRTTLHATNLSDKSILLLVVKTSVTGASKIDIDDTRADDYFFRCDLFAPGTVETFTSSTPPFGEPREKFDDTERREGSKALASVAFVQFLDGSSWGDSFEAKNVLEERSLAWQQLKYLVETYRTKGEQQFVVDLMKPSQLTAITSLQSFYTSSGGDATTALKRATAMVNCADMHSRGMKRPTP